MKRFIFISIAAIGFWGSTFLIHFAKESPPSPEQDRRSVPPIANSRENLEQRDDVRAGQRDSRSPGASDLFDRRFGQVLAMPPDTAREDAIRELAQEWARVSPAAAERWARRLQDPAERERALTQICFELAAKDPREAIRIAQTGSLHPATVDAIVTRWAGEDFSTASSWVGALPDGEARDRMLMRLVQSKAGSAPDEAAAMLSESPLSGTMQDEAAMAVLHQWLLKDPEAAREWVELFQEGPLKERAIGAVRGMTAHRGARDGG